MSTASTPTRHRLGRPIVTFEGSGVEDHVAFHVLDAAALDPSGDYDLVHVFESLHDMSYPVEVLRAARRLLADGGVVPWATTTSAKPHGAGGQY